MNWKNELDQKRMTVNDAAALITSGDNVALGSINGFPLEMVNTITARPDLENIVFYTGLLMTLPDFLTKESQKGFRIRSLFMGPVERMFRNTGLIEPTSIHLSKVASNRRPIDTAVLEVSPPDKNGYMCIGPGSSLMGKSTYEKAKQIIVQINPNTPFLHGTDMAFHVSEVDAVCDVDRPLFELPDVEPDEAEKTIAGLIAEEINDGDTLQIGYGKLADAIGERLHDKKDLGVHTELLTPSMISLFKNGVITGRRKTLHREKIITSFSVGKKSDYEFLHNNSAIEFHPASYVNNPYVIGKNRSLVSINTALSVDLTGQVASESIGFTQYSATGGQLDFVRGAGLSENGRSYITLKSTSKSNGKRVSRICSAFPQGTVVTTPRSDVHYIATEYGVVDLSYKSIPERVNLMIGIAHPDNRETLAKEAVDAGLVNSGELKWG